jgi:hypothetical protein
MSAWQYVYKYLVLHIFKTWLLYSESIHFLSPQYQIIPPLKLQSLWCHELMWSAYGIHRCRPIDILFMRGSWFSPPLADRGVAVMGLMTPTSARHIRYRAHDRSDTSAHQFKYYFWRKADSHFSSPIVVLKLPGHWLQHEHTTWDIVPTGDLIPADAHK